LLSCEDESLLIWWDTFLVLDLGLDVLDGICWLDIKSDGLTSEGFDENLHLVVKFIYYKNVVIIRLNNSLKKLWLTKILVFNDQISK
jgi:hypothetical protein